MEIFAFDLLPYAEHLDHRKEGKELPWPLPKRHFRSEAPPVPMRSTWKRGR